MNKENTEALWKKYPKLFIGKDKSIKESSMPFGFEVGDGWYWLIDNLCKSLQWDIDENGEPQIEATQVKEKFGELCFYVNSATTGQYNMIRFAESLSCSICEKCGATGATQNKGGWIRTLCEECI